MITALVKGLFGGFTDKGTPYQWDNPRLLFSSNHCMCFTCTSLQKDEIRLTFKHHRSYTCIPVYPQCEQTLLKPEFHS